MAGGEGGWELVMTEQHPLSRRLLIFVAHYCANNTNILQ